MLSDDQKSQFVRALAAANLGIIDVEDVVETRDTLADFGSAHRFAYRTSREQLTIHSFHVGRGNRQVHVADFGDVRACYAE